MSRQYRRNRNKRCHPSPLSRAFTDIRQELRMTQADFAELVGVSSREVRNWEKGRRSPSPMRVAALNRAGINPLSKMKVDSRIELAEAMRVVRRVLGLRQVDLADALGVSIRTVKRWEGGKRPKNPKQVAASLRKLIIQEDNNVCT